MPKLVRVELAILSAIAAASAGGAIGVWADVRQGSGLAFIANQARTSGWEAYRQQQLADAQKGSSVLTQARHDIGQKKLPMPRDAAICLEARRLMDDKLIAAIGPGRDFAQDLSDWHAENAAVGAFCDYSLHIGPH